MDPRVAKFIEQHHTSPQETIRRDVDQYRGLSVDELWRDVVAVCQTSALLLAACPDRARVMAMEEPPHASYRALVERLRRS